MTVKGQYYEKGLYVGLRRTTYKCNFQLLKKILLCAYMEDTENEEKSVKISHISVNNRTILEKL